MNYLAHLFLSSESSEAMLGAMLGDFVKGADKNNYPPNVRRGIELHRQIDSFTDAHEIVLAAKRQFAPERRRFAGIALDIFYDHCLAKNWSQFSAIPLRTFTNNVYETLKIQHEFLRNRAKNQCRFAPVSGSTVPACKFQQHSSAHMRQCVAAPPSTCQEIRASNARKRQLQ